MFLQKIKAKYSVISGLEELTEPGFRYTFNPHTLTNLDLPEGLYRTEFRGHDLVLQVDRFGEVRVAKETPCPNEPKLAMQLLKDIQ